MEDAEVSAGAEDEAGAADKFSGREMFSNRYTQLLISLVALFVLAPFILKVEQHFPVLSLLFLLVLLFTLRALELRKHLLITIACFAFGTFLLESLIDLRLIHTHEKLGAFITMASFAFFIGISILIMIYNLFHQQIVSADSVRGGIAIYLLFGVFWGVLYQLIALVDPNAFMEPYGHIGGDVRYLLFYFSFGTLTSLAFGDIMPASEMTRILAITETVTGILFLSVFIAQLVSLHMAHKMESKKGETK